MGKIKNTYSQEFKLEIVKMYLEEGITALGERRGSKTGTGKGRPRTKGLSLEEEVARLRMENAFLKKLREFQRG
ncbi:hypothetical protein [Paenibacillus polymyxa]|uniref:hypothetical protein n=1 Tax=Paenibacillus polymyxa TaxID=1406 RepID=UPI0023785FAB|nr:hypothetical protein [Paenibacillus polymyxa]WDM20606.1 hypothetical protein J4I02_16370 [Paenibacillus polymyxa]